jgi:hypothetical protein
LSVVYVYFSLKFTRLLPKSLLIRDTTLRLIDRASALDKQDRDIALRHT